jgi:hypothetical protein
MKFLRLYRCSRRADGCRAWTFFPFHQNPRKRWMIDVLLENTVTEEDGTKTLIDATLPEQVRMHLCPKHVMEHFMLEERDYIGLEDMESTVREVQGKRMPTLQERIAKRFTQ